VLQIWGVIPDPKTATKENIEKKTCHTLFVATNITSIYFLNAEGKNLGQFFKNYFLPKKLRSQSHRFGIRDPVKTYSGSLIPDPGVKKAPDPQHFFIIHGEVSSLVRDGQ
jgi:hypothetical protein